MRVCVCACVHVCICVGVRVSVRVAGAMGVNVFVHAYLVSVFLVGQDAFALQITTRDSNPSTVA